ncbi:Protein NLP4 [Vitis vinifera]|uniref:Protein NLP4 n=1 Tax=Vitis vinifera TaxID=29760 RepID=A0A438ET89_VITVI|nr:Protein NLP4 [Vitis vinifera]
MANLSRSIPAARGLQGIETFLSTEEYPRVDYAQHFDVRGTLALPVFEQGSQTCLGVIEVVMTTEKSNYRPELESVCKALEAVDLRSSEVLNTQNACNKFYQAALPEILEVLTSACGTHELPLAQTWGFLEACSEHHLLKGQGVAGRALTTNEPCFSADIASFSKTRIHVPSSDFVLEFFLPVDCRDAEEQKRMLCSLSIIIQKVCPSLRVVRDKELEETPSLVSELTVLSDGSPARDETQKLQHTPTEKCSQEQSSWTACLKEAQQSSGITPPFQKEKVRERLSERYPIPPAFCTGRRGKDNVHGCVVTSKVVACIIPKENNFKQPGERYRSFAPDRQERFIQRWVDALSDPRVTHEIRADKSLGQKLASRLNVRPSI